MRPFIVVVVFGMLLSGAATATAQTQSDLETLDALTMRMQGYTVDLIELTKAFLSTGEELEWEVSSNVLESASRTTGDLRAVGTLLVVYVLVRSPSDRLAIRPIIATEFTYFAQRAELSLRSLSLQLARTQKPGLAALANSLRDDVRSVQRFLEGITLR